MFFMFSFLRSYCSSLIYCFFFLTKVGLNINALLMKDEH